MSLVPMRHEVFRKVKLISNPLVRDQSQFVGTLLNSREAT